MRVLTTRNVARAMWLYSVVLNIAGTIVVFALAMTYGQPPSNLSLASIALALLGSGLFVVTLKDFWYAYDYWKSVKRSSNRHRLAMIGIGLLLVSLGAIIGTLDIPYVWIAGCGVAVMGFLNFLYTYKDYCK